MDDAVVTFPEHAVPSEWFDDVYRDHWRGMVRLAFVMVGDTAAAEDLVQEAFARVYKRRAAVLEPLPYLRSAVYNACRNHLRSESRRWRLRLGPVATEHGVGDHVIDVVHRLPERQRLLVVLRYYAGLSDSEIAAVTNLPVGTVKSTLHRALAVLREELSRRTSRIVSANP